MRPGFGRRLAALTSVRAAWVRAPRLRPGPIPASVAAAAILLLIGLSLWISLRTQAIGGTFTLSHYSDLLGNRATYRVLANTAVFAAVTLVVATLFGLPMAWLVERTDLPFKSAAYVAMTAGILIPGFSTALGWLFLLEPRIGLINAAARHVLGLKGPLFDVVTLPGMGFVQGLTLAPIIFVMTSSSFRAVDPALEEAAYASGANLWRTLRRVTLPLVTPGLLAAAIFVLVVSLAVFDVPAIIGLSARIFTFSTYLYFEVYPQAGEPDYGFAAAFCTAMLVLAVVLTLVYTRVLRQARRYELIGARASGRRLRHLGSWRWPGFAFLLLYVLLAEGLPIAMLVWTALLPYLQLPSSAALKAISLDNFTSLPWDQVQAALVNTVILMLGVPTLAIALSLSFSWIVLRTRWRGRLAYDYVAFLPQAVPSIIFAFSALIATLFLLPPWSHAYGSIFAILVVMALVQVAFGSRLTNSALIQISRELEEAGAISGARSWSVLWRIIFPLMRPTLVYGWLWMALLAFRELTVTTMLAGPDSSTLAVVTFDLFTIGQVAQAAALALVMLLILLPLLAIYLRLVGLAVAPAVVVARPADSAIVTKPAA